MIQIADHGHDIFMVNNRGTQFGQTHTTYDIDSQEFWDWDLSGFAEDIIASAQVMNETANAGKGWYFGYSQGTTEAMVALATRESEMEAYFKSVVLLAPCFFTWTEEEDEADVEEEDEVEDEEADEDNDESEVEEHPSFA